MSCPYSTILGIRGQGVHSSRIFGFAFNDFLATIVIAIITAYIFNISFLYSFFLWFVSGEILHYFLGVDTAFLEMIGFKPTCSNT